ncbi:MAG TPA: nucleoside-diphosphate sugar epimerase/dehydratase [Bryobacteraceae bacterium]
MEITQALPARLWSRALGAGVGATKHVVAAHRTAIIVFWQIITVVVSLAFAFLLRFDFTVPPSEINLLPAALGIALASKVAVFQWLRIGHGLWRFASVADLRRIVWANIIGSALFTGATIGLVGWRFPRSVYVIDFVLCFLAASGGRLCVRLYHEAVLSGMSREHTRGVLIYGAGAAGMALVREIRANPMLQTHVLGFLDDDRGKRNAVLFGVPVLGRGREAARIVERLSLRSAKVSEIVIAMPSATGRQISDALANCRAAGVPCKIVPGMSELLSGKVLVKQIREVSVEDLLGREPVQLDEERIREAITGRTVMITGAGGSIGSELCRQVSRFDPAKLVAFEQSETDLFRIEMELSQKFPSLRLQAEIGDIRDYTRVEEVIQRHSVQAIFHAAAYKHVPLMERHTIEAVRNNVIGTHNLVMAAYRNRVSSFLMISSDKAVRPANIMGLTKRIAELVVSSMPALRGGAATRFVCVRFGNVLGSNGSVVPIFKAQIAAGGPVTVTHPDMRRYFMTIPEAVELVLQASTMGNGSEIFALDMGAPVRILDLARNMIRLSGHEPDEDIPIRFTGLRPGEKLFEELRTDGDDLRPTYHEKIMIFTGRRLAYSEMQRWITELKGALNDRNVSAVLAKMKELAPEYQPEVRLHSGAATKAS